MATSARGPHGGGGKAGQWRVGREGSFSVRDSQGRLATPRGRKARAIIAFLSAQPDEHVSRDRLLDLLWGDRGEAQARSSLRQSLFEINHCAPGLVSADRGHLWIEAARLEPRDGHDAADLSSTAVQPFDDLDDITPEFDDWLRSVRVARLAQDWSLLRSAAEESLSKEEPATAARLIERMRRLDAFNEDWVRLGMRAACAAGNPAAVTSQFRDMEELLQRELGVPVSGQTRALRDDLLAELSVPHPVTHSREDERAKSSPMPLRLQGPRVGRAAWLAAAGLAAVVTPLALSQSARTSANEPRRIAVLPFEALGGVDASLAEGMAEEVLSSLSQQKRIQTVGRTSSWMFKGQAEDLRRVGRKLDVDYVVEGSARMERGVLRVNMALVDTRDASMLWSGRFDSASGDAQRIERAASGAILQSLGLSTAKATPHTNPRAYALYVRGKALIRERNYSRMMEARDLLERAVAIDPKFAPAWAQLGGAIAFVADHDIVATRGAPGAWRQEALAAAQRSVELDPRLADGHAMLALIYGFETDRGRDHLRHALQLDPNNSQIVYWWGNVAAAAGNNSLQERAARRAMALDPLWRRPAQVVSLYDVHQGRRGDAYAIVERLRRADPGAALEVEMTLARGEGDLSRVVSLGRAPGNIASVNSSAAKLSLGWSLAQLGYVREALLLTNAEPIERFADLRRLPGRDAIMVQTRHAIGTSDETSYLQPILFELARTGRDGDVAALFDRRGSELNDLQNIREGNREQRAWLAAVVGRSLMKIGRRAEAARLFRSADEAVRVVLANGTVLPEQLGELANTKAAMGKPEEALPLLEQAVAKNWLGFQGSNYRLDELPWFAPLRGNARFERIVRTIRLRLNRERRETEALGLI